MHYWLIDKLTFRSSLIYKKPQFPSRLDENKHLKEQFAGIVQGDGSHSLGSGPCTLRSLALSTTSTIFNRHLPPPQFGVVLSMSPERVLQNEFKQLSKERWVNIAVSSLPPQRLAST